MTVAAELYESIRRSFAAKGYVVRASLDSVEADDPSISSGSAAPTAAEPNGSIYLRSGGAADTTLYVRVSGAWVAVEGTGTAIAADTISEVTAGAGVTIDGAKILDSHIVDSVGFYDPAAPTKVVRMDAGAVTAGQTRVLAMPDADVTITSAGAALLDDASAAAQATTLGLGTGDTPTHAGLILGTGNLLADFLVRAVIAVADSAAGVNDVAMTVDLYRLDGSTVLGGARQVMITCGSAQYQPQPVLEASVTFGTATKGSIIASGGGWCLAETDADGEFDCTVTNTGDETLYFWVETASKVSDSAKGALVVASNSDVATWSA